MYISSQSKNTPQISFGVGNSSTVSLYADDVNNIWFTNANKSVNSSNCVIVGRGATTTRSYATAIGHSANAGSYNTTSIGDSANAVQDYATAIGVSANAGSWMTTAIGYSANASGSASTAMGYSASASGDNSTAIGRGTIASSGNATAIGYNASASKSNSTAIGAGASASEDNTIVIGTNKDTVIIRGNLVVEGHTLLGSTPGSNTYIRESAYPYRIALIKNARDNVDIASSSKAVITAFALHVLDRSLSIGGTNYCHFVQGEVNGPSDRRLKNVGKSFTGGLEQIRKMELFHYTYKADENKTPHVGIMAQDLQKIFPDAVTKGEDGFLRIRMEDMFYAAINSIKELDSRISQIDQKQKKIDELEQRIDLLEKRITELESK
jgi:hypothetical protein